MYLFRMQCFKRVILSCLIIKNSPNSYYECIFDSRFNFFGLKSVFYNLGGVLKKASDIGSFGLKSTRILKYLEVLLKIRHIQIQIYPQTSIEPKYGEFT